MLQLRVGSLLLLSCLGAPAMAQTYFPAPSVPAGNPVTTPKALLGMALFWDEQMSSSNTTACGTCHVFSTGGVDPRAIVAVHPGPDNLFGTPDDIRGSAGVPARDASGRYLGTPQFGIGGQVTTRKAPSVINVAYQPNLFYDGRAAQGVFNDPITGSPVLTGPVALENLVSAPPLNTVEMGHAGRDWRDVTNRIANARPLALASNVPPRLAAFVGNAASYDPLFEAAFGPGQRTSAARIVMALATYLRTLVSDQTPYDRALAGQGSLSASEARGLSEFSVRHGQAASCVQCHGDLSQAAHRFGPTPTQTTQYGSLPVPNSHNIGVRPIADDRGVGVVSGRPADEGRFRTPGLRNAALHGTWFHNGAAASLTEVVEFYNRGGDFHVNQAPEVQPRNLNPTQVADIVAFLNALVDPRVAAEQAPFDRPRLQSETGAMLPIAFGVGMTGTGGRAPRFVAQEPVFLGNPQATIAVRDTPANTAAFVMWDTERVQQGFTYAGIRFHLGLYDFALTYAGQTTPSGGGLGFASLPFGVPRNQALRGMHLYAQWLLVDPVSPVGVTTSDASDILVH